ncbi:MAG: hypothetical protein ACE5NW_10905 [Acidiferrobacterales bacterium]
MEDKHIRRLAVLNRDKTMAGFLSVDDLARHSHELAGRGSEGGETRPLRAERRCLGRRRDVASPFPSCSLTEMDVSKICAC